MLSRATRASGARPLPVALLLSAVLLALVASAAACGGSARGQVASASPAASPSASPSVAATATVAATPTTAGTSSPRVTGYRCVEAAASAAYRFSYLVLSPGPDDAQCTPETVPLFLCRIEPGTAGTTALSSDPEGGLSYDPRTKTTVHQPCLPVPSDVDGVKLSMGLEAEPCTWVPDARWRLFAGPCNIVCPDLPGPAGTACWTERDLPTATSTAPPLPTNPRPTASLVPTLVSATQTPVPVYHPTIAFSPDHGPVGAVVSVTGAGFPVLDEAFPPPYGVTLAIGGTALLGPIETDAHGNIATTYRIVSAYGFAPGTYTVTATARWFISSPLHPTFSPQWLSVSTQATFTLDPSPPSTPCSPSPSPPC